VRQSVVRKLSPRNSLQDEEVLSAELDVNVFAEPTSQILRQFDRETKRIQSAPLDQIFRPIEHRSLSGAFRDLVDRIRGRAKRKRHFG